MSQRPSRFERDAAWARRHLPELPTGGVMASLQLLRSALGREPTVEEVRVRAEFCRAERESQQSNPPAISRDPSSTPPPDSGQQSPTRETAGGTASPRRFRRRL